MTAAGRPEIHSSEEEHAIATYLADPSPENGERLLRIQQKRVRFPSRAGRRVHRTDTRGAMTATAVATAAGSPDQARALRWAIDRAVASFAGRDPSTVSEAEMIAAIETAVGEWCAWFELVAERAHDWRYTPASHRSPFAVRPSEIDYVMRALYDRYRAEQVTT